MWSHQFRVQTGDQPSAIDITEHVARPIAGLGDGLLHVFLPHATAGLALMETGSGSEVDLLERPRPTGTRTARLATGGTTSSPP